MKINTKSLIISAIILSFGGAAFFLKNNCSKAVSPPRSTSAALESAVLSWDEAIKKDKPIAIEFYADWCGACRRFKPMLSKLIEQYGDRYNFVLINGDHPENATLMRQFQIQAYPSLYLVDYKQKRQKQINYYKLNDENALKKEFESFLK